MEFDLKLAIFATAVAMTVILSFGVISVTA
ncbi:YnhF family membrane protein [Photobacterium sp. SDRW27]|nr:YnhF family membrane protein [Photobacterium obscurum]MCW8327788.1 YnhF family membrane protein [Photobacterium obscurum]